MRIYRKVKRDRRARGGALQPRSCVSLVTHMAVYLGPGVQLPSIAIRILMAVRTLTRFMQCKRSMTISIDQQGRRFYLRGNTYPVMEM